MIKQVLEHHLTAFANNDLDAILKDYTEASVVITRNGSISGLVAIRQFFEDFFNLIPTGSDFEMRQQIVVDQIAYIAWQAKSATNTIPMGTDTFVFESNKIKYHTVADYRIS